MEGICRALYQAQFCRTIPGNFHTNDVKVTKAVAQLIEAMKFQHNIIVPSLAVHDVFNCKLCQSGIVI